MKKRSFAAVFFTVIAVLFAILLLAVGGVLLYITVQMNKTPVELDDISAHLRAEPMDRWKRLRFEADGTMHFTLDENDIWWFISQKEGTDFEQRLASTLAEYHLSYSGMGLTLEKGEPFAFLKCRLAFLPINVRIPLSVQYTNGTISVSAKSVDTLGRSFTAQFLKERFGIELTEALFSYDVKSSFLSEIRTMTIGDGTLCLSGPMETRSVSTVTMSDVQLAYSRLMFDDFSLAGPVAAAYDPDPGECYASLLPKLMNDASVYGQYLDQLFALLPAYEIPALADRNINHGFFDRWYGPLDLNTYQDAATQHDNDFMVAQRFVQSALGRLYTAYKKGQLKIRSSDFILSGKTFRFEDLYGDEYSYYSNFIPIESGRLCLVGGSAKKDGIALSSAADSASQFSTEVKKSDIYGLGILLPGADGCSYVLHMKWNPEMSYYDYAAEIIPDELYTDLMSTEVIPVWIP